MVFQELENLLLLTAYEGKYIDAQGLMTCSTVKNKSLLLNIKELVIYFIFFTGPPEYFSSTIKVPRPILLLPRLFILLRISHFILQSNMNNLLNNQGL